MLKKFSIVFILLMAMTFVGCNKDSGEEAANAPTAAIQKDEITPVPTEEEVAKDVQIAVLPLVDKLGEEAQKVYEVLSEDFVCVLDDGGNIGKRYTRYTEQGVPFCVTIDYDTETMQTVGVRINETEETETVEISELKAYIEERLADRE